MITVTNEMRVYEVNGQKLPGIEQSVAPPFMVRSHWNEPELVVLIYGDIKVTVVARDLIAAVANAQNMARH